jgi:putative tryptophan/tyrosine transport system substrate-binding protein
MRLKRLLILLVFFTASFAYADIAVLKTAGVIAFDEARNGFSSICFETQKEFDLNEDLSNKDEVLNSIRSGNFSLVFAIGSQAANLIRENLPDTPLVFAFVVEPDKQGFKKDHSTGIALKVPVREQFIVLKTISRKFKKIGVIYTQPFNDSIIAAARSAADDENLEIVAAPIRSSLDLQQVMTDLVGKAEVIWIPPDPSLNSEEVIKYIGSKSLENKIPCVGPTDRYVRSGAIFSYSVDPVETGRLAGELANKVLEGTPTNRIPFQESQKPKVIINLKAAALLGLTIPKNLQDAASKIYQ